MMGMDDLLYFCTPYEPVLLVGVDADEFAPDFTINRTLSTSLNGVGIRIELLDLMTLLQLAGAGILEDADGAFDVFVLETDCTLETSVLVVSRRCN